MQVPQLRITQQSHNAHVAAPVAVIEEQLVVGHSPQRKQTCLLTDQPKCFDTGSGTPVDGTIAIHAGVKKVGNALQKREQVFVRVCDEGHLRNQQGVL